jgi:hypothetical protein
VKKRRDITICSVISLVMANSSFGESYINFMHDEHNDMTIKDQSG